MATSPLSLYIQALRENHALGVKETSSYGALQTFLDSIGATLKPTVRCILHPSGKGAGIPDGGLFTREQLQPLGKDFDPKNALKMTPARGALEVKGTADNMAKLVASDQVAKYLATYGKVICTNYREFAVVELRGGVAQTLETFAMESSEAEFWAATSDIKAFEAKHGESLRAFLERALLYGAPLASPEAVAAFMASCAREAKVRVERANVDALEKVRASLEAALNVSFHGDDNADSFFRSSLVQTLFYGVFSAWILWCREYPTPTKEKFDWRLSAFYLPVPVIQALFHEFSNPQTIKKLDITEPLDWVTDALNRVDRPEFEKRFSDGSAVQYFYEPFLEAFDPELRKQLGVWYTPQPIVKYMVERVDTVLKTELGIAKGLADESVVVLDPCCGTGAFLVEVIHHIANTLGADQDALGASDLKKAVLGRLFGFELLTAPFVVAHLQMGLLLQSLGAGFVGDERAPIFLTNALTGWKGEPPQKELQLEGLIQEFEAAREVKEQEKILVILGNPPYSGYAGIAIGEERELSQAYREKKDKDLPAPEGQGLNELYVRFFRMAERKITERKSPEDTTRGIVCYVSNYSWLDGKSHSAMREAYLERFSKIWIDNLNGDRYRTGKVAPDGTSDPSIFSSDSNRDGIQVGTAIALMVKSAGNDGATLHYRDLWGSAKHAQLEAETAGKLTAEYGVLNSPVKLGLPFMPTQNSASYLSWKKLPELFPVSFPGVTTSRDDVVVDVDRERLEERMKTYFDASVSDEAIGQIAPAAMKSTKRFNAATTRSTLKARGFLPQNMVRYGYRPFDVRWLYWEPETKLLDEKRTDYWPHAFDGNLFLFTTGRTRKLVVEPSLSTPHLNDYNCMDSGARGFPLYLRDLTATALFEDADQQTIKANLTVDAQKYLDSLGMSDGAKTLFLHALAIQHAPLYRTENADALRLDWPRVPQPTEREVLEASGELGARVAALLDVLQNVEGVTQNPRAELKVLGPITKTDGGALQPDAGHLAIEVNWGYRANGAVMPGGGRAVERPYTPAERAALTTGAAELGLDIETLLSHIGETCFDVYLNDVAFWSAIPSRVWSYTMGGYRVLKKWLSYREQSVLGRDLKTDEAREFTAITRRIAALLLLETQLNANYAACKIESS